MYRRPSFFARIAPFLSRRLSSVLIVDSCHCRWRASAATTASVVAGLVRHNTARTIDSASLIDTGGFIRAWSGDQAPVSLQRLRHPEPHHIVPVIGRVSLARRRAQQPRRVSPGSAPVHSEAIGSPRFGRTPVRRRAGITLGIAVL